MSNRLCPHCDERLDTDAINVPEGVALCPTCGELMRLSEVLDHSEQRETLDAKPPDGCSVTRVGREVWIDASLRSVGGTMALLFACLFWNGIVSVFVLVAIAGLYQHFIGPPPDWFPAPEQDGKPMTLGMVWFLCIFLIPFVTVGICLIGGVLLNLFGHVRVMIDERTAFARTGIGPLRWTRRFDPREVREVREKSTQWQSEDSTNLAIQIVANRTFKFGGMLRDDRREWLQAVLHELLVDTGPDRREELLDRLADRRNR